MKSQTTTKHFNLVDEEIILDLCAIHQYCYNKMQRIFGFRLCMVHSCLRKRVTSLFQYITLRYTDNEALIAVALPGAHPFVPLRS